MFEYCPICKNPAEVKVKGASLRIICPRCGDFTLFSENQYSHGGNTYERAKDLLPNDLSKFKLSAWVREQYELNKWQSLELNLEALTQISLPIYSVSEKILKLMHALERRTSHPGSEIKVVIVDSYPLAWAVNEDEFQWYLKTVVKMGLVDVTSDHLIFKGTITAKGWEYLEEHHRVSIVSAQAFIAMSFDPAWDKAREEGIKPGIVNAGYTPFCLKGLLHTDNINNKIIAGIKESRFVVVDFSTDSTKGQRGGVYFEAGYALGLGIPVIWCVEDKQIKDVHFDTQHYNIIRWKNNDDLKGQLTDMILAVVGRGKLKH